MGERKGQNFYYPPDFNYKTHKNLNKYHGTHALRERASKIHLGILVIRFEMPFDIWCLGCNNHVAMGVRYNAEKKKVDNYYTTPIYEFRMKCHLCDNYYVIRTDPKNFDYELVEGCRRQEKRWDPTTIDQFGAIDRQFGQKLAADAMFKLEHGDKDKTKATDAAPHLQQLEVLQYRLKDDFGANQALRRSFRDKKTEIHQQKVVDDALRQKSSIDIDLLPETDEDKKMASLLAQYRTVKTFDEKTIEKRQEIINRPLFTRRIRSLPTKPIIDKPETSSLLTTKDRQRVNAMSGLKRTIESSDGRLRDFCDKRPAFTSPSSTVVSTFVRPKQQVKMTSPSLHALANAYGTGESSPSDASTDE